MELEVELWKVRGRSGAEVGVWVIVRAIVRAESEVGKEVRTEAADGKGSPSYRPEGR